MHIPQLRTALGAVLLLVSTASSQADIIQTLDQIPTWVGSGANRAGLVIDWGDSRDPVAWGYRWDGSATAETLVRDVDAADASLVASLSEFAGFGAFVDSFGYDRNGNGFSTSDPNDSFGQADLMNFWEFFTAPTSPYDGSSMWTSSDVGMSSYTLADGNWVGFRFDADFPGPDPGPVPAAVPEPSVMLLLGGTFLAAGCIGRIRRKSRAQ
jgi:hypothetical protein